MRSSRSRTAGSFRWGHKFNVLGFVVGVGGWAQPTIGAPIRSGSHITMPPWIPTVICRGISVTRPPWLHMTVALVVSTGGIR